MSTFHVFCRWIIFLSAIWLPSMAFKYANCPGPMTVNTTSESDTAKVSWSHPYLLEVGQDGSISQTVSHNPGEEFPIGLTRVNYLAINTTDYRDLKVCSFVITVKDPFPPIFQSCPTNVTSQLESNQTHMEVTWEAPLATDNSKYVQILATHKPGDDYIAGSVTVTYTARDMTGNVAHCTFPVIVIPATTTAAPTTATTTEEVTTGKSSTSTSHGAPTLFPMSHVDWKVWTTRGLIWVSVLCAMTLLIIAVFVCRKYYVIRRLKKNRSKEDDSAGIYPSSAGEEYDMWEDPPDSPAFQVGPRGDGRKPNKAEVLPLLFAASDASIRDQNM
ncbi:sushi, von Willebrand factor type A, EGF and pentraxin domain-containing protein 1-like [Asterias amurensis]|uniref:sushi, von Willebrand factor type A, EGF and pentraxin domain-containing protein 1-like n=1 Tax=Asterias amurensis TaxID=7602 RepID=UPI003AB2110A